MSEAPRHGLGDPRIPWVVLLDVTTADCPAPDVLAARLSAVADQAGWPTGAVGTVRTGTRRTLLGTLAADPAPHLAVGVHPGGLVIAARHDALDGLAMIVAASRLLGIDLRSGARGVADRAGGGAGALLARAWEVSARPQARVAASPPRAASGDAFAAITVDASPRTADLVVAGSRAVVAWNAEHGRPARRVSVAIGVSTAGGDGADLADRSGFLRLRDVERKSRHDIAAALGSAPLQPGSGAATSGPLARVAEAVTRIAAPRLGSTLLVSHLGTVSGDLPLAFYPVTGGGSGLSIGAATVAGRTCITARARAVRYADEELEHLLELLVGALR